LFTQAVFYHWSIVGMAVWLGWLFAPSPIAAGLSMGLFLFILMMAAFFSGNSMCLVSETVLFIPTIEKGVYEAGGRTHDRW
jgi:hypothetical protein